MRATQIISTKNLTTSNLKSTSSNNNIIFYSFISSQATEKEQNDPERQKRYISNKINRYTKRLSSWGEKVDEIKVNEFDNAINKVFHDINVNNCEDLIYFVFFRDFILYLLLKYKIVFSRIEAKRSMSMHDKDYFSCYEKDNKDLERCKNVFLFTKLMAKHFPYLWKKDLISTPFSEDDLRTFGPLYKNSSIFAVDHHSIAFLIEILSFYKRSYIYSLLSENKRAFNDYTEIEDIMEKVRQIKRNLNITGPSLLESYLSSYKVITLFRKGELYRKDYSFINAVHYFRDCEKEFDNFKENPLLYPNIDIDFQETGIRLLTYLSKGKAFLEIGELRRTFKWFVKAIDSALKKCSIIENNLLSPKEEYNLEDTKSHRHIDKLEIHKTATNIFNILNLNMPAITNCEIKYLISDITNRLGVLLFLLNVPNYPDDRDNSHKLAKDYIDFSLKLNSNNLLAKLNLQLILNELNSSAQCDIEVDFKNIGYDGSIFEKWSREYSYLVLKTLRCHTESQQRGDANEKISRNLLKNLLTYTDNLITKNSQFYRYLIKDRTIGEVDAASSKGVRYVCLRRWSSFSPFLPQPSTFAIRGGGYLLIINGFGIAIDPGHGFLENLFAEGFSIDDIDAVLVTHDHADHHASLDGILTLLDYRNKLTGNSGGDKKSNCLYMFFNHGTNLRYSALYNKPNIRAIPLSPHTTINCQEYNKSLNFKIDVIRGYHSDMTSDSHSVGVVFNITDGSEIKIGYTGDTSTIPSTNDDSFWLDFCREKELEDLLFKDIKKDDKLLERLKNETLRNSVIKSLKKRDKKGLKKILDKNTNYISKIQRNFDNAVKEKVFKSFEKYFECDVLILHISCIPFAELRSLTKIKYNVDEIKPLRTALKNLQKSDKLKNIANQIGFAHWYMNNIAGIYANNPGEFDLKQHLYLGGVLKFMKKIKDYSSKHERIIVISEFREEMGSFRNKIAKYIKDAFFKDDDKTNLITADIGLSIRLKNDNESKDVKIKCSTCSNYNDYEEEDIYHGSAKIREVCVKREEEGVFYNCERHDPSASSSENVPDLFIERIERYDVLKNRYL